MTEIRDPLLSERAERLFALEEFHMIGVLDRDELGAVTTTAAEARKAPIQGNRLLSGFFLTSVGLVQAAWFVGLVYVAARLL